MLINFFLTNVWLAIGLWAFLYVMDYVFTLRAARIYQRAANKHFSFEAGYELNPYFKDDIARLRRFSFRFLLMLLWVAGLLLILNSTGFTEGFALAWGALVCTQIAVHFRHIRNLALFHYAAASSGIDGRIAYQHWLSLRLSAVEFLSFTALFLFLFLLWGNYFVLGGALGSLSIALRHLIDSSKKSRGPGEKLKDKTYL